MGEKKNIESSCIPNLTTATAGVHVPHIKSKQPTVNRRTKSFEVPSWEINKWKGCGYTTNN